jgi:hypothetical protein
MTLGRYLAQAQPIRGMPHEVPVSSALAPWAIVATASGLNNTLNATAIALTWLTSTTIYEQMILKMTLAAFTIYII